jgi:hypothetical protein
MLKFLYQNFMTRLLRTKISGELLTERQMFLSFALHRLYCFAPLLFLGGVIADSTRLSSSAAVAEVAGVVVVGRMR